MEQPLPGKKSLSSPSKINFSGDGGKNSQTISQDIKISYKNENLPPTATKNKSNSEVQGGQTKVGTLVMNGKPRSRPVNLPPKAAPPNQRANSSPPTSSKPKVVSAKVTPSSAKKRLPRQKSGGLLVYALRLIIFGVGTSAIAGTLLSVLNPATRMKQQAQEKVNQAAVSTAKVLAPPPAIKLNQEIMPLKAAVQQLGAKNKGLTPGAFFVDLDTNNYLDWNGSLPFAAASTIKVPILVAFFQDVDAGKIRLDEKLTLKKELIGGGSGAMQYQPLGTKFTALATATQMIVVSDNTATNILINRMGGIAALNQRFQSWGLGSTKIHNPLPDLTGTNVTSPKDLGNLMSLVDRGELMSLRSRDRLLEIMRRTKTVTLLPKGLGEGAIIAHKTGDIGSMVADVGLVDMPSGKRYIAVAMVKRPHNDPRAQELIRQISRTTYQQFAKPPSPVMPTPRPFITTSPQATSNQIPR